MSSPRLFIGFRLPAPIREHLIEIQNDLRSSAPSSRLDWTGIRWTAHENLHLTVRYLGPTDEAIVPELLDGLDRLAGSHSPIGLTLNDLGYFPDPNRPRVLWIGVSGQLAELHALRATVDSIVDPYFGPDPRGFKPHITLAYLDSTEPHTTQFTSAAHHSFNHKTFTLDTLCLIRSERSGRQTDYIDVVTWKLGPAVH